jgi:hypothetical protein
MTRTRTATANGRTRGERSTSTSSVVRPGRSRLPAPASGPARRQRPRGPGPEPSAPVDQSPKAAIPPAPDSLHARGRVKGALTGVGLRDRLRRPWHDHSRRWSGDEQGMPADRTPPHPLAPRRAPDPCPRHCRYRGGRRASNRRGASPLVQPAPGGGLCRPYRSHPRRHALSRDMIPRWSARESKDITPSSGSAARPISYLYNGPPEIGDPVDGVGNLSEWDHPKSVNACGNLGAVRGRPA